MNKLYSKCQAYPLKVGEKKFTLKTKLKAYLDGKLISENYSITLDNSGAKEDKTIFAIQCDKGQETWRYYLESLMNLNKYNTPMSDILLLDEGRGWCVTGMIKVYQEIINTVVLRGISI